jgi:ubiquitin carboxyl-terminal hydrolase 14
VVSSNNLSLSSPEAPEEQPSVSKELALKLECNISGQTNFLMSGILDVRELSDVYSDFTGP